jgi:hypothetical protein
MWLLEFNEPTKELPVAYTFVVVMWLLEFNDITYELLDVYKTVVFTNAFADIEVVFITPAILASDATFTDPNDPIVVLENNACALTIPEAYTCVVVTWLLEFSEPA